MRSGVGDGGVELELQKQGQKHRELEGTLWAEGNDEWWARTLANWRRAAVAGELCDM
jgi:hypothetical protein